MPLKPYNELVKIDVLPFCEKRKAKDDNGRTVEIPYLNWAMCKQLLHENGAGEVYYTPRMNQEGSYVFQSIPTANKDGRRGGCYFVSVEIHIDDLVFTHDMPLMNGSLVVYEDTVNQLRIANSHARAFVKGVAIRTGLGFGLWVKGDEINQEDDPSGHSIKVIKKRVEELLTIKMQDGRSMRDIAHELNMSEKNLTSCLQMYDKLDSFEKAVARL